MANNESSLIREFAADANNIGAHSRKISDRFNIGIPDLWCCYGGIGCWLEFKYLKAPAKPETPLKVDMTALQREFIRKEQRAGGNCGWVLGVKFTTTTWRLYAGNSPDVISVGQDSFIQRRKRGEMWDIARVMEVVSGICYNEDKLSRLL